MRIKTQVRTWLRGKFFNTLGRALRHDEGKAACVSAICGLLPAKKPLFDSSLLSEAAPYAELASSQPEHDVAHGKGMVILTGRFRSGTTLLWNMFRNVPGCTAYYEPFNERRWFDQSARGNRVDATHRGVSDYWREYEHLQCLEALYDEDWTRRDLYMDQTHWNARMKRYIELLVEHAPERPVLKFNRLDFRLPWVRRQFPDAKVVHIFRHPRDQWLSTAQLKRPFPPDGRMAQYAECDEFYLLSWARDLSYHFPFLDEREIEHPYQLFYFIWKLSLLFGRSYADVSLRFEDLVMAPRQQLESLFESIELEVPNLSEVSAVCVAPQLGKWRQYASQQWFANYETECDAVLGSYLGQTNSNQQRWHKAVALPATV